MNPTWSVIAEVDHFPGGLVVAARLVVAAALGGVIGLERQKDRKAAGLRTHMLVALGTALFTLSPLDDVGLSGVIQGVATGIGFLGAGWLWQAVVGVALAWFILNVVARWEAPLGQVSNSAKTSTPHDVEHKN